MKDIIDLELNVIPTTWGSKKDKERREEIREKIKAKIPNFGEEYIENIVNSCEEMEITLNCYHPVPEIADIDNLPKIPIDAVLFSAKGEPGYEIWESKVNSLKVRKIKNSTPRLHIRVSVT